MVRPRRFELPLLSEQRPQRCASTIPPRPLNLQQYHKPQKTKISIQILLVEKNLNDLLMIDKFINF